MLDFISRKNTMVSKRGFGNSNPQQRFALFSIFILLPQILDFIFMGQIMYKSSAPKIHETKLQTKKNVDRTFYLPLQISELSFIRL